MTEKWKEGNILFVMGMYQSHVIPIYCRKCSVVSVLSQRLFVVSGFCCRGFVVRGVSVGVFAAGVVCVPVDTMSNGQVSTFERHSHLTLCLSARNRRSTGSPATGRSVSSCPTCSLLAAALSLCLSLQLGSHPTQCEARVCALFSLKCCS